MMTRSIFKRIRGLAPAGALAALWPFGAFAQGLGGTVDQTIRNPAGQGIQRAAVAHVTNAVILLLFWAGFIGLVALIGFGAYGLVEARGDQDRAELARGRVRWGGIGLGLLVILGLVGWLLLYR